MPGRRAASAHRSNARVDRRHSVDLEAVVIAFDADV